MDRTMQKQFWAYAGSEGTDQPVHPRSLVRAFAIL